MANININIAEKLLINFSPVFATLLRDNIDVQNLNLNYSNGSGQQMATDEILYLSGIPNILNFIQVKVVSATTLSGSGSIPIELSSYPNNTQQDQTVQSTYDGSVITYNLSYNTRPLVANHGFTIDNRSTKNFASNDFNSKFTGFDGNTLAEVAIIGNVDNYFYDTNGNNNYVPYVSGAWIPVNDLYKLKFVAPDQNNYYVQTGSWTAKDSDGLQPTSSAVFSMAANDYIPSPVQYNGYALGQTTQCESAEQNKIVVYNNTSGNYNFLVGYQYSNSQGYPAQTLRIEGYLDEHFFKNNNTGERIPVQGFVPKNLRNSTTNTSITTFPYDISITNVNQLTVELGGYDLTCIGNPNPSLYTPMRQRTIYYRILDSNGNIGPLQEAINFITPTIQ